MAMTKRLTKSSDRMLAGICGGVADYFELDPTLIRACYATFVAFSAFVPGILLYVFLCFIVPKADERN